ncbi:hypothetical protein FisN_18Hh076 [Fistulifera solaris]|uniref:HSF-type DNA-binding domain-containing protein n=1 Tax=Fistulifera solaris TaxID=1519565 RepID=A0A1Z5JVL5_FISSO|nr:hypothetical protein FisN_18Hh076 [Fistulifera solaris]|eukprot:GAX17872.1 hypothetical protein FisN_18Hh076 [Fistulifera solaris]
MCLQQASPLTPEDIAVSALTDMTSIKTETSSKAAEKVPKARKTKKRFSFPVQPTVIQSITPLRGQVDHSYRDFSKIPAETDYVMPSKIEDMSFAEKLQDILSREEFKCITWLPHGRAFKVIVPLAFERQVCEEYFGHKRYSSFLRQLNNHGFKHVTKGPDRNSYYHECFLRNMPHLCKYMPDSKDARRQIPDPENEPDLYEISKRFPFAGAAEVKSPPPKTTPPSASASSHLSSRTASELPWMVPPPAKRVAVGTASLPSLAALPPVVPTATPHLVQLAQTLRRDELIRKAALVASLENRQALQQFTATNQANVLSDLILRNMFR